MLRRTCKVENVNIIVSRKRNKPRITLDQTRDDAMYKQQVPYKFLHTSHINQGIEQSRTEFHTVKGAFCNQSTDGVIVVRSPLAIIKVVVGCRRHFLNECERRGGLNSGLTLSHFGPGVFKAHSLKWDLKIEFCLEGAKV